MEAMEDAKKQVEEIKQKAKADQESEIQKNEKKAEDKAK